ncbi:hypothetical protein [Advenella sp. FME57]|uniref:hypothetical protein n=1 Tax=Advenella sp. FME57 TaxID=2742604 RepID=UPI001865A3A4|nr:hypothetical protein [Advenella sp. FME57]
MINAIKCVFLSTVAVFLIGCAASGVKVSEDQLGQLVKGQTSRTEVLSKFGKPTTQMRNSDGTATVFYNFAEYRTRPATFIPIVGIFAGGSDIHTSSAMFRFDANDRLVEYSTSQSDMGTGMGRAAGPIEPVQNQPRK